MIKRKLRAQDRDREKENGVPQESSSGNTKERNDPDIEENTDYEFRELSPDEISIGYDNDVKDWLARNQLGENEKCVTVYKYLNAHMGERKEIVNQHTDYIPSEHEIGINYGSGRYIVIVNLTDNKGVRRITSAKFRISSSYDKMRYDGQVNSFMGNVFSGSQGAARSQGQQTNINEALDVIGKIMALILPALRPSESPVNYSEMMLENYKVFNSMLKRSMLDNMQLATDLTRERLNLSETMEDESEVSGIQGIIQSIAPVIEQFIPLVKGRTNAKSKATIEAVKQLPQYRQIVKSRKAMNELISFIDEKHGIEIADKILTKFGMKRKE